MKLGEFCSSNIEEWKIRERPVGDALRLLHAEGLFAFVARFAGEPSLHGEAGLDQTFRSFSLSFLPSFLQERADVRDVDRGLVLRGLSSAPWSASGRQSIAAAAQ